MAASAWTRPVMLRAWLLGTTALLPAAGATAQGVAPNALPTGGQVVAGQAAISQSGTAMQVRQGSDRAAINWQGFNIGASASVNFQQPSASSWTLNRVTGPDPSVIAGRMTANGGVAIVNQSGMVFAQGAQVNVGSLIASAANITNENFMAGRMVFDGAPRPGAKVENHGSITVADRGLAALVGPRVGNTGMIRARLGRVALAGAETYSLDLAGDGLLAIDVTQAVRTAPGGAAAIVTNSGVIEAHGGAVLITAHAASGLVEDLVRNTGRISADTAAGRTGQVALRAEGGGVRVEGRVSARGGAGEQGGRIELRGSTTTTVAGTARVDASGGAGGGTVLAGTTGVGRSQQMSGRTTVEAGARLRADARQRGNGGTIAVNSTTETVAQGRYSVRGGTQGGGGGLVELSGQHALSIAAQVDAAAPKGQRGTLLIDPTSIQIVDDSGTPATPGAPLGTVTATTTDGILLVRASDLSTTAATVTLQASQNITISTPVDLGLNTLRLFADGAIAQADNATITAGTLVIRGADGTSAAGSASLGAANQVGTLDAAVQGTLIFSNGAMALTVARATTSGDSAAVSLTSGSGMMLTGAVGGAASPAVDTTGAMVTLAAGGSITQAGGTITAKSLTVTTTSGSIDLTGTGNQITGLTATAAGNGHGVAVTSGLVMSVLAGGVTAGKGSTIGLTAPGLDINGSVGFAGGADSANRINFVADALSATAAINDAGTGQVSIAPLSTNTGVDIGGTTTGALQTDTAVLGLVTTGQLNLSATGTGALVVNADLTTAAPVLSLTAGGDITQAAGKAITAERLVVNSSGGKITLGEGNAVGTLDAAASGAVAFRNAGANLAVAQAVGSAVTLTTGGALDLQGTVGQAGAAVGLNVTGAITQTAGTVTADTLTVRNATTVAGTGAASIALDQANAVKTLDARATGTLSHANGSADLTVTQAVGSAVTLTTSGALTLQGVVGQAGGTVGLNVDGAISQTGGMVTAATLTVRGVEGGTTSAASASFSQANAVGTLDVRVADALLFRNGSIDLTVLQALGSGVTLMTGGDLALQGAVSGTTVALNVGGDLSQTAAGLATAGTLTIRGADGTAAAGAVTLDQANSITTLDVLSKGDITVTAAGTPLGVAQAQTMGTGKAVKLADDAGLSLTGTVGGTGAMVTLTAASGGIVQGNGAIIAASVTATAGAESISLGQAGNQIAGVTASSGGSVSVRSGVAMTVLVGGVQAAAGASIALQAPRLTVSNAVGFAEANAANSISLVADTLSATTAIDAGATGLVRITPLSGDRSITIGTGALEAATLNQVTAGRLILEASGTGALALNSDLNLATVPVLELIAAGGITQDAATVLTVGKLSATASAGTIGLTGQNRIGRVTGSSGNATLGLAASGDIALTNAQTLETEAALAAGMGRNITLRADSLALGAQLRAVSGSLGAINLLPLTAGRNVVLGANAASALSLDATQLGWLQAGAGGTLRIGGDGSGAPVAGSVGIDGAVGLRGRALQGLAGTLDLQGSSITQSAALDVATLAVVAASGNVTLAQSGNTIDALGRISAANGTVSIASASSAGLTANGPLDAQAATLTAGSKLVLAGNVTLAGDLVLRSNGAISQSGGRIKAGGVLAQGASAATAASVQLLAAGNDFGSVAARATGLVNVFSTASTAGGTFTIGSVQGVDGIAAGRLVAQTSGTLSVAQAITLTDTGLVGSQLAGTLGLGIANDVTAAGDVLLRSDGAIGQTAGRIQARGIAAAGASGGSAGSVALLRAGNDIGRFAAAATGGVDIRSSGATAGGTFTIGTVQGVDGIIASRVGVVTSGTLAVAQAIRASDTITLQADKLTINAIIDASSGSLNALNLLPLTAGRGVLLGSDDAARFSLATEAFAFLQPGNNGTLRIGSDGTTTTAGSLVVAGDVTVIGSNAVLDLRAHDVSQTGGVLTVVALTGAAETGFALDATAGGAAVNMIGALGVSGGPSGSAVSTLAGDITILSARGLTVRGDVTADSVTLRGQGLSIGESAAKAVLVRAARGNATLDGGTLGFGLASGSTVRAVAGAAGGDIIITAGGGAGIQGLLDASAAAGGRDVSVTAGSMVLEGSGILAARGVTITSGGSFQVATGIAAGRDALLTANVIVGVASGGSVSAGRDAIVAGSGSSSINGAITGGRSVRVTSTGGNISIGTTTISAGGGPLADATAELRIMAGLDLTNDGTLTSAGRDITLVSTARGITNGNAIDSRTSGGAAGAITLTANAVGGMVTNTASGTITGGTVTLNGQTQVAQNGAVNGTDTTVSVGSGASGNGFVAGSGSQTIASGTLAVTALSGAIAATGASLQAGNAMSLQASAGGVSLTGSTVSGSMTVAVAAGNGAIRQDGGSISAATGLTLTASGDITQDNGGRIVTPVLSGSAGGNVLLLDGVSLPNTLAAKAFGNAIGRIDGFSAGGNFTLASTASLLQISNTVSAGTGRELRLFADDFALTAGLLAPGGTISLSPYTRNGSMSLALGGASEVSAASTITLDDAELGLLPVGAAARLRFGRVDTPDGRSDLGNIIIAGQVDLADPATGLNAKADRLELHARNGIAQQAGTRLVVPVLAATAGTDISLDPGNGGNRIAGLGGIAAGGDFILRNGFGGAMAIAAGSAMAGDAGQGPDGILVGNGARITLRVDDLAIAGTVRAPAGTIEILPETMGRPIHLGGGTGDPAALFLDSAELALLGARTLRIGEMTATPSTGTGLATAGSITLGGAVDLQGPVAQVEALRLVSGGAIQGSLGAITVAALDAATVGDIILDNAGNRFLVHAASGANVTIAQADDLRLVASYASGGLNGPGGVTATGTLSLTAGGTITQDSGALIRADTLRLQSGGAVTLGERNRFNTLAAVSIGGAAANSLIRGLGYTVSGPVTTTGSIRLVATDFGNLTVTGSIDAAGAVDLATERGEAAIPGAAPYGRIGVSGSIHAGTTITLGTDIGEIVLAGATTVQAGGAVTLATGLDGTAGLAGVQIGSSTVKAGSGLTISAGVSVPGGAVTVTGSGLTAGGDLGITATAGSIGFDSSTVSASGALVLSAANGSISQRRGSLSGAALSAQAGLGITVTNSGGAAPSLSATGGALSLATGAGDISITGATLSAATGLGMTATAGAIGIGQTMLTLGGVATLQAATGLGLTDVVVQAGGGMTAATATGNATLLRTSLTAGGGLSLAATAGQLSLDTVTGKAATAVTLVSGGNTTIAGTALTATAGALGATAGGGIGITGSSLIAALGQTLTAQGRVEVTGTTLNAKGGGLAVAAMTGGLTFTNVTGLAATAIILGSAADTSITGSGLTATSGTLTVTAGGAIGLGQSTLSSGDMAKMQAATGLSLTDVTLLAGGDIAAATTTGSATLLRTSLTAGGGLSLAAMAGTLRLDTVTGKAAPAVTLVSSGNTTIAGTDLTATAGALGATAGGGIGITGSSLVAGLGQTLTAQGAVGVTNTTLTAKGGDLAVSAQAGGLGLDTVTGSASGAMTLASGSATTIAASSLTATGGAFGATAAGAMGVTGSSIIAGLGQSISAQGGFSATGTVLAAQAGGFGITAATGNIALDSSTVSASGALALTTSAGSISQRRGGLSGASITAQAARGIMVTADGGDAPRLTATSGALGFSAGTGDVALTGAVLLAATDLGLAATTGAIGVTGSALTATSGALSAKAAGAISFAGSAATAGGGVALGAGGDLSLANSGITAQAGVLAMIAGGGLGVTGSTLVAAGDGTLSAGGLMQASGSTITAGEAMTLGAGQGLNVVATRLQAGGRMTATIQAGDVTLTDAVVTANALGLTATSGGVAILRGSIGVGRGITLASGGGFTAAGTSLTAGAGLAVTSRLAASLADTVLEAGGTLAVTSTAGGLTQTRGSLTGGDVSLRGAGDVLVTDAGSGTQPLLRSTGGPLSLRSDAGSVTLRNVAGSGATGLGLAAGGGISLTDTTLTTPGRLAAAAGSGGLAVLRSSLASTAGDVDMTAGGAGSIGASTLRASRQVRVGTGGGMTLSSLILNAEAGDFEAGRPNPGAYGSTNGTSAMTTNGVTATIGTALLFAAPGGVANLGPTLVTPRGTPLPAVLFDTRLAPDRNPLTIVQPDIAGTPANQQPTQVRSAPGSQGPGAFGLPNQTTAAGPVALDVNAGQSAVFLLIDGGGISGTVTAGRLAVHGAGGGATLSGALNGSNGAEAARFADITRPIDANSLQKYRFNSCVVGSINCVVPPSIQILPPRPTDQARFTIENNRINLSDVLIPNIGEEDDE